MAPMGAVYVLRYSGGFLRIYFDPFVRLYRGLRICSYELKFCRAAITALQTLLASPFRDDNTVTPSAILQQKFE